MATGLAFPEGPIALQDGSVILVEIERQTLSRVFHDGRVEVIASIPGAPNGAALGPDGRIYVCNNGGLMWRTEAGGRIPYGIPDTYQHGSIEVVDIASGAVERLYDRCGDYMLKAPNDIVFDSDGNFWFTDTGKRRDRDIDRGFIYWARADGSEIREVVQQLHMPNGIGISPDGRLLYVSETETGRIWSWEITGPGEVRKYPWPSHNGGRLLINSVGGMVKLDGFAVTAAGNICAATIDSCCLLDVSSDGKQIARYPVPDLAVTNVCFGGPDMRTAYVTLSNSGRLAVISWHEPGLRLHFQK